MSVARVTEITATSEESFQDAINKGMARATETLKDVDGAWVQDQKIIVEDRKVTGYRVTLRVNFVLSD